MFAMKRRLAGLLLATSLLASPALHAQETAKSVPQSAVEMQMSFAPLVKQTSGAVVNVYAERMVERRAAIFDDPFFQQFFGQRMPNRTEKQSSLGSGVIVDKNGMVVTNYHVIEGADDIKVALADGREFPCEVVLKDDRFDLAVLKIKSDAAFPVLPVANSDKVEVGDLVLAIGNPFGVGQTVTSGIVSGLARNQVVRSEFGFFIQTDAAINPGNSGGALINVAGELIGINTAIFSKGGGSNGVGFAIPANLVRVFLQAAESGAASFERPYLGATFEPVTSEVAEALGLKAVRGALVIKVAENGPAGAAGLKPGEVITAVNDIPVEHPDALGYRLMTAGLGKAVRLTVLDNGAEKAVNMTLATAPETKPREELLVKGANPLAGAMTANLSPKVADELRMPAETQGVVILDVKRGSPAARLGFAPHDVIVSINGVEIDSTKTLATALAEEGGFWRVEIERDGQRLRQFFR